jgi:hypothetical protein
MQMIGGAERFVIARENNVVRVDFRRSDPPAPDFPGAGGMRALKGPEHELGAWSSPGSQVARRLAREGAQWARVLSASGCASTLVPGQRPEVEPQIVWAKIQSLAEGARIASRQLRG